jgi:hypothetical protein
MFGGRGGIYDFNEDKSDFFSDINEVSGWAKDYILKAGELKLVLGDENGNINPKDKLTRAQFVTLLVRMLDLELPSEYKSVFSDVKYTSWYLAAIEGAYGKKIITGVETKFFPRMVHVTTMIFVL